MSEVTGSDLLNIIDFMVDAEISPRELSFLVNDLEYALSF
tara:strand:+ start:258 stop:377 length:120 start_codon:yes stop_codon:yes gene_type:complete